MSSPSPAFDYPASVGETLTFTVRPRSEFFRISAISLPVSLSDSTSRLSRNLAHFRGNYAGVALFVLLFSLVYQPISIIVLLITIQAWFFFYFSRSVPLVIFNFAVDDRFVLAALGVVTVLALVFSSVWWNLLASILISGSLVCLHGVLRVPNFGDDPYGAFLASGVDESGGGAYSEF